MTYKNMHQAQSKKGTPQTAPVKGRESEMIQNDAGGYGFRIPELDKIRMFLIAGVVEGTYYVSAKDNFADVMETVTLMVAEGKATALLNLIEEVNTQVGDKPAPAIRKRESLWMLAVIKHLTNDSTVTRHFYDIIRRKNVVSTLSQLMELLSNLSSLDGKAKISSGFKSAIQDFFISGEGDVDRWLAYQFTKYRNRSGVTARDVLRLAHVKPDNDVQDVIFWWVADNGKTDHDTVLASLATFDGEAIEYIRGFELLQTLEKSRAVADLILEHGFTWEMIPSQHVNDDAVLMALLGMNIKGEVVSKYTMPMTALIRNIPRFASQGMFKNHAFLSRFETLLTGENAQQTMVHARLHPVRVAMALKAYGSGRSRNLTFNVDSRVTAILWEAFKLSFGAVQSHGKRVYHAVDISGSMWSDVQGASMFTCAEASALILNVALQTEPLSNMYTLAFTTVPKPMEINKGMSWNDVESLMDDLSWKMGGTDCSQPMLDALEKDIDVDAFVIYTDNETYAGSMHPYEALELYRQSKPSRKDAKLVVWAMQYARATIIDTEDSTRQMQVSGFDATAVDVVAQFIAS